MKRYLLAAALIGAGLLIPTAAHATGSHATTVHVISTPDDGAPPWARDTFTRKTTVTEIDGGFTVTIADNGTFTTPGGVDGTLTGYGTFTVAGGALKTPDVTATIDRSGAATKGTFTGEWWKRFLTGGDQVKFDWKWTYASTCWNAEDRQTRTESSDGGVKGDYPDKVCPSQPSPSTSSASPSPSAGVSHPSTSPSASRTAVAAGAGSGGTGALAVTGPPVGLLAIVGAGLALLGGALFLVRRRKTRFTA